MPLMKDPQGHEIEIALPMVVSKINQGWKLCETSEVMILAAAKASAVREQVIAPSAKDSPPPDLWIPRARR